MRKNIFSWFMEWLILFLFLYIFLYAVKNPVNLGWVSISLVALASFGVFASPLTRHLSMWNNILDRVVQKEEEKTQF